MPSRYNRRSMIRSNFIPERYWEIPEPEPKNKCQNGFYTVGEWIMYYLELKNQKPIFLSREANIPHQRIYDYIKGNHKLSVETSFKLEKALDIKHKNPGFLYRMQAMHDIFMLIKPNPRLSDSTYKIISNQVKHETALKNKREKGFYTVGEWITYYLGVNNMKPIKLASRSMPHQRIYEFINGKRRIKIEDSFRIEKFLGMGYKNPGFFYRMQIMHDIFMFQNPNARVSHNKEGKESPNIIKVPKKELREFRQEDFFNLF